MKFVTAAYGAEYREFASGLARSFREYMPCDELTMFGDGPVWGSDVESLPIGYWPPGVNELAIKTIAVSAVAGSTDDDVCWLDCDQLVTDDLRKYLVSGKFNVIGYGCDGELRKIGGGDSVPQCDYILSGLFSMPADVSTAYREDSLIKTPPAEGYDKLIEQELVNRLARRFNDRVNRLDKENSDTVFGFVGGGHPTRKNQEFCSMKRAPSGEWTIGSRRVASVAFTAECLRDHRRTGFDAFTDKGIRSELQRLYKQGRT